MTGLSGSRQLYEANAEISSDTLSSVCVVLNED
jgi:hypothetical protein